MKHLKTIIILTIFLAAIVGIAISRFDPDPQKRRTGRAELQTMAVKRGSLEQCVQGRGTIKPKRQIVLSSKISGTIDELLVTPGDKVNSGQPVAKLIPDPRFVLKLARARKQLRKARNGLKECLEVKERTKNLFEAGVVPRKELERAKWELKRAKAEVEVAERSLKVLEKESGIATSGQDLSSSEVNIDRTIISSPIQGIVLQVLRQPGEIISSQLDAPQNERNSNGIMVIGDLTQLVVHSKISEADVTKLQVGQKASIRIKHLNEDKEYTGRVTKISRMAERGGEGPLNYFQVNIGLREKIAGVMAGMSCRVSIEVKRVTDVLQVPSQAIFYEDNTPCVFLKQDDGRFIKQEVTLGLAQDQTVAVSDGLKGGQEVCLKPLLLLEQRRLAEKESSMSFFERIFGENKN